MRISLRRYQGKDHPCFETPEGPLPVAACLEVSPQRVAVETLRRGMDTGNFLVDGAWDALRALWDHVYSADSRLRRAREIQRVPADSEYRPPIACPPLFFGLAKNCPQPWRETGEPIPNYPIGFNRAWHTLTGHDGRVTLPADSTTVRCAIELGVVIGKTAFRTERKAAMDHVAGYTVVNDMVSNHWKDFAAARHPAGRPGFLELMVTSYYGRGTMGFAPVGPAIVDKREVPNPYDLLMHTRLNGVPVDRAHTNAMIVPIDAAIAYLSAFMPLPPGSVLHMGTMGLDGWPLPPEKRLDADAFLDLEIEKVGVLRTRFRDCREAR